MTAGRTIATESSGIPIRGLRVEVVEGPDAGRAQISRGDRLSIGTGETNDLVLSDPTVSRYHLDLSAHDKGALLVDQGSTNGCIVTGVRVERGVVPIRSIVKLGRTSIRVDAGETVTVEAYDGQQLGPIVGRSSAMRRLMLQIDRVANAQTSVLLHGETGSGKEVVARAIHEQSSRKNGPLETVDCGALLPSLVASELFGHEKGAFTGAERRHIGAVERASGGTLFLDEMGELPPDLQTTLLGVLERKSFRRVGGTESVPANVRVVAATHRDLRREVNVGRFRQDLYYRLAVVTLEVPALRERSEDIPLLAEHFLRLSGHEGALEALLPPATIEALMRHDWPGNVRELRNAVEAAMVMGDAPPLDRAPRPGSAQDGSEQDEGALLARIAHLPYSEARDQVVDRFEAFYIEQLLNNAHGNVTLAAKRGKMNRTYLTRLLKRRGIERPE